MTTPDFTIAKMTIIEAKPNTQGNRLLAAFDLLMNGIRIVGCVLTESPDSVVKAKGPFGKTHSSNDIRVVFEDPAIKRAITRKAAEAYAVLSGREVSDE